MIPKNKRRTITVDGVKYEYCIGGKYHERYIFIKNLINMEEIHWNLEPCDDQLSPKDIKELIATGGLFECSGRNKNWKKTCDKV